MITLILFSWGMRQLNKYNLGSDKYRRVDNVVTILITPCIIFDLLLLVGACNLIAGLGSG